MEKIGVYQGYPFLHFACICPFKDGSDREIEKSCSFLQQECNRQKKVDYKIQLNKRSIK
jgi:hypothetical protein